MPQLNRTILIEKNFLHFPIKTAAERNYVQIYCRGTVHYEHYMPLTEGTPDFYAFLDVSRFRGEKLVLTVEAPKSITQSALDNILQGDDCSPDNPLYQDLYREKYRPRYHFSTRRGWTNDANGLIFYGGKYHMYYQHNPYDTEHGGVCCCWGHAVSDDLVTWEEHSDAIMPKNRFYNIASGTCFIDENNTLGYGAGALIAAYTGLLAINNTDNPDDPRHSNIGQLIAYTKNGGESFIDIPENPVLFTEKDWRDPCVFYHKESGAWIMLIYECTDGKYSFCFYRSDNLINWSKTSHIEPYYECPDIYRVNVRDEAGNPTDEEKWVLCGANGRYMIGDFDGFSFTPHTQLQCNNYGKNYYAGQTWKNSPDGEIYHIYWMAPKTYADMPFSQHMSIVTRHRLIKYSDGSYRLLREPIEALKKLRGRVSEYDICNTDGKSPFSISAGVSAEYDITVTNISEPFYITVAGKTAGYDPESCSLIFIDVSLESDKRVPIHIAKGAPLEIQIFTDVDCVEFYLNRGEASASYCTEIENSEISVKSKCSMKIKAYEMNSIWNVPE